MIEEEIKHVELPSSHHPPGYFFVGGEVPEVEE
jgi:hypothetical protein